MNIQNLLDKYFDEKTSPQDEAELRAYFKGEVASEFEMYKPVFDFVAEEKDLVLSNDFDTKLVTGIMSDLTEKYFAGETDLAEEEELRNYYSGANIAPELQKYQTWFAFLKSEKATRVSADFNDRVLTEIKGASAGMKVVSRRRNTFLRVAAGVALLIGMLFFLQRGMNESTAAVTADNTQIDWSKYEVKTEAEAVAETEEAMRLLAKAFGKSTKKAGKELNKTGKAF